MTDEERFAKEVRDLALSIRAPRSVSTALDRAAAHAVAHPTSRFALSARRAVAAAGVAAVLLLVASLVVATAPASASDLLVRAERAAVSGSTALNAYRGTTKGENWMGPDGKRLTGPAPYE